MGRDRPSAGSIRLRRDGRWEARVTLTDPDGRRIRRSLLGRSRPDVEAKLRAAMDAETRGLPIADARLRLADHLTDWLENVRPRVRPRTYESYESVVRVHLIPALGHVPLIRLTPQQVQTFLNRQSAAGGVAADGGHQRDVLRQALHQAERWGQLGPQRGPPGRPAAGRPPGDPPPRPRPRPAASSTRSRVRPSRPCT